jgi:hypothetical protein
MQIEAGRLDADDKRLEFTAVVLKQDVVRLHQEALVHDMLHAQRDFLSCGIVHAMNALPHQIQSELMRKIEE